LQHTHGNPGKPRATKNPAAPLFNPRNHDGVDPVHSSSIEFNRHEHGRANFGAARTGRRNVRVRTTALSLPKGREFPAAVEIFDIVGGKWRLARLLLGDTGSLPLARWRLWVALADNRKQAPLAKADNPRTSQFRQGGVSRGDSPPWEQVPGARAGARTPGTPLLPGSTGSQSAGKRRTPVSAPQCAGAES